MEVEAGGDIPGRISLSWWEYWIVSEPLGKNLEFSFLCTFIHDLPVSACMLFCSVIPLECQCGKQGHCWEMTQHREYP